MIYLRLGIVFIFFTPWGLFAASLGFDGLTTGQNLVGQDGWTAIYTSTGGVVQAASTVPELGSVQTVLAPGGQFAKANVVSGLSANGVIRMDVLVQYYNGSPLQFAPAADGVTSAGAPGQFFAPQLNIGFLENTSNQAILKAGGASATGAVQVNLPATIGFGEWVWFRLELDCADTSGTGNVVATASYRNLSDGETSFTVIPGLQDITLSLSSMSAAAQDPSTWTSVWLRYDNPFSTAGRLAQIKVEQVATSIQTREIWSAPHASLPTLGTSNTAVTADLTRIYAVVVAPDQSARVVAMDQVGNELSSTSLVAAGGVNADAHNAFSIAIDPLGYLHVIGNMHNDHWQYWISSSPRSAAAFEDHGVTDSQGQWGAAKIGGRFSTYANFFRDNFGRLWLTARTKAVDDNAEVIPGSLAGFRGGLLARYDPYNLKVWEPVGARAPAPGNTWQLPVITWDGTGRQNSGTTPDGAGPWYQAYRINLDFNSHNDMLLGWMAFGSVAEGAPYADERLDGATHLNFMRKRESDGLFVDASGGVTSMPADRWDANILYRDPGDLNFAAYAVAGDNDEPFVSFNRNGKQWLMRRDAQGLWEELEVPLAVPDVSRQLFYHQDVGLVFTDFNQVLISQDRGDTWQAVTGPNLKHVDKAFFRLTGNLIGATVTLNGDVKIAEYRFNQNPKPIAVDDPDCTTRANEALAMAAPGVLGNDLHPEFSAVTVSLVSQPANGAVVLQSDGSFTYTPDADFTGEDSFVYQLADVAGQTAQATATITVRPGNNAAGGYETFDVVAGELGNGAGGSSFGFEGKWQKDFLDPTGSPLTVASPSLGFSASGNRLTQDADGTPETAYRRLANPLRFSTGETGTHYFSFVLQVESTPTAAEQQYFYLLDRFGDPIAGYRRYKNNRINCFITGDASQSTDSGQSGQLFDPFSGDWLVVMKLETHPTNPDTVYLRAYRQGEAIVEPTTTGPGSDTWSVTASGYTDIVIDAIRLGLTDAGLAFDDIRMGSSFAAVTNDVGNDGVSLFATQSTVDEADGVQLPFQLARTDPNGPLSIYYTTGGSATNGADYAATTGVVTFADGESVIPLGVPLINDTEVEDDEQVTVTLLEDAGYAIANSGFADVTIAFNDFIELADRTFNQSAQTEQIVPVVLHNPKPDPLTYQISANITQDLTYTEQISSQPGGPTYEWIEISGTGTNLTSLHNDAGMPDAYNVLVDLGSFSFPFYGQTVNQIYITPYGMISPYRDTFNPNVDFRTHQPLGQGGFFNHPMIAAMWQRWIVGENSTVYHQLVDADTFVVQYQNLRDTNNPNWRATFQIVIKRSGMIQFNYKTDSFATDGHQYGVGIQGWDTDTGIQTHYVFSASTSQAFIQSPMSIRYLNPHLWMVPLQTSVTVAPGSTEVLDLGFYAHAFSQGHSESGTLVFNLPAFTREDHFQFQMDVGSLNGSDAWRWQHFGHNFNLSTAADLADPDDDGIANLMEYGVGTLPMSATPSPFTITGTSTGVNFNFMRAVGDLDYIIESSTTLEPDSWTEVLRNPGNVSQMVEESFVPGEDIEFFRLRVERP